MVGFVCWLNDSPPPELRQRHTATSRPLQIGPPAPRFLPSRSPQSLPLGYKSNNVKNIYINKNTVTTDNRDKEKYKAVASGMNLPYSTADVDKSVTFTQAGSRYDCFYHGLSHAPKLQRFSFQTKVQI